MTAKTPHSPLAAGLLDIESLDRNEIQAILDRARFFQPPPNETYRRLDSLRGMSRQFGLPDVVLFADADRVLGLAELVHTPNRPLREWMTPSLFAAARDAADELEPSLRELADAEAAAVPVFTGEALAAPVAELHDRFEHRYQGLKKLSGDYRADKKTLTGLLTAGTKFKQGLHHLPAAVHWVAAVRRYDAAVAQHAGILGRYWRGRETDFASIADALGVTNRCRFLFRLGQRQPRPTPAHAKIRTTWQPWQRPIVRAIPPCSTAAQVFIAIGLA